MTLNDIRFNLQNSPSPPNFVSQRLSQLQADLMSTARKWAVDEVGAAMAHQLNEPLTALLLYLHEIKEKGEQDTGGEVYPASMREMVDHALQEMQRLCDIMERLGHPSEVPIDAEAAVARGREAIDSWLNGGSSSGGERVPPSASHVASHPLTAREREVLALIIEGVSNKQGGHRLGISTRTFEVHRAHIMDKVGARNAAELVRMALSEVR